MRQLTSLLLLLILFFTGPAQAQSPAEIVDEAHALFHQASDETNPATAKNLYSQALLRYEQVYRDQPEARLAYNIGNTYYRLGDLGRALVNYRRAEQELAADVNLQHNLALVRSQRQDQFAPNNRKVERFNLHRSLSLKLRTHIFLGLYVAFWLAAVLWYRKRTPLPTWMAAVLLLATLLAFTSVGLDKVQPPAKEGVIVTPEIMARQGDGRNYQAAFASPLHSGTEFVLVQKRDYWLQIELADGRQCWIPSRSAELI
ncbi:MAG: tetratricopeptide repeat protein [Proteobacteria bacterium]|nr:tetratricopeptide repeat protein [Pseudomonadota bacterium]